MRVILQILVFASLFFHISVVRAQMTIMGTPKQSNLSVFKYDSLTNFEEKPYGQENPNYRGAMTYHHLIGQTIMYCGSYFNSCKYGEYYKIESVFAKSNNPYLGLVNIRTKQRISITGISFNTQFIVQGYYEKIKRLYVGKKFQYTNALFNTESTYFDVETGNYAQPQNGSVWECVDIQVENRSVKSSKYSPLLMLFQAEGHSRRIYCYYDAFYDMQEIVENPQLSRESFLVSDSHQSVGDDDNSRNSLELEQGMSKKRIEEAFLHQAPSTKSTSVSIKNGKMTKHEQWKYDNLVFDEQGNPMVLILTFENEQLIDWSLTR